MSRGSRTTANARLTWRSRWRRRSRWRPQTSPHAAVMRSLHLTCRSRSSSAGDVARGAVAVVIGGWRLVEINHADTPMEKLIVRASAARPPFSSPRVSRCSLKPGQQQPAGEEQAGLCNHPAAGGHSVSRPPARSSRRLEGSRSMLRSGQLEAPAKRKVTPSPSGFGCGDGGMAGTKPAFEGVSSS